MNKFFPPTCLIGKFGFIANLLPVFLVSLLFFPPFIPASVHAGLLLSKSLPHYSEEMEFYYLKPRPEMLPDLLKCLHTGGILANNEKQLMIAAFFAALVMDNKLDLAKFVDLARKLGRDASRTIAWSVHLARHKDETSLLASLLDSGDALLARQISNSPAPLDRWDIFEEPAIMQMYWGAFMATGKDVWLDRIINAALIYGHLETQGLWQQRGYNVGRAAAASLYEFAPRHPVVKKRLEKFLSQGRGVDEETLRKILQK